MAKKWRRWTRSLHRDLGYLTAGLTVAYAVSGFAVNHKEDWNSNRSVTETELSLGPVPGEIAPQRRAWIIERLELDPDDVRSHIQQSATDLRIFFKTGSEISIDPTTGVGRFQEISPRPLLREFNALHLNDLKGVWTWIADAYAVILAFLAISGLVLLRGRLGFAGRGKWLFAAGIVIPVAALWWIGY